ncbi:MAG: Asp-tRNA(Asn)/Glu-tRNA(Gln) amidotransferase subunit GatB, partial [Chloroflexi bacterium]
NGHLEFSLDGRRVRCGITRVHLEEDTGTLHHAGDVLQSATSSLVDYNRSGVPLMEIVGEPDLRSAEEAREYLVRLRQILMYIGVNDGNLEEGSFRCDANVSVRPRGSDTLGVKVEIKNMNSFRAVQRAVEYEITRQITVLGAGETLHQETRGWVEARAATVSQRSKEHAHDYRYFPEPDLAPMVLSVEMVEEVRHTLPELPEARAARLVAEHGIGADDAGVLTATREEADSFERLVAAGVPARLAANWQVNAVNGLSNAHHVPLWESGLGIDGLAALLRLVDAGTVNQTTAKELLEELYLGGGDPGAIVRERGLGQVSDAAELAALVDAAIEANAKAVADFQGGKEGALQAEATKGRADAKLVNRLLRERLSG